MTTSIASTLPTIGDRPQTEEYQYGVFKVGARAQVRGYTDVRPCTVIEVACGGTCVKVRFDRAELAEGQEPEFIEGGFSGHCTNQSGLKWDIIEDENGATSVFTLRKWRGRYVWTPKGGSPDGIQRLALGWRAFHDYNF